MSFAEIKEQVIGLTQEERMELAALIAHLSRTNDPQYQADLDRRLATMEAGKKFGPGDLNRLQADSSARVRFERWAEPSQRGNRPVTFVFARLLNLL